MKIYLIHATAYPDYEAQLYEPFITSKLISKHTVIFPHLTNKKPVNSKEIVATADLIIAEVSCPSIGLGIELGWAEYSKRKIICLLKEGARCSAAVEMVCSDFIHYSDREDMIKQIQFWFDKNDNFDAQA